MAFSLARLAQGSFLLAALLLVAGCDSSDGDLGGGGSGSYANKVTVTATPTTVDGDFAYRITFKNTSSEALVVAGTISPVNGTSVLGTAPFSQPNLRPGQDVTQTVSFYGEVAAGDVSCYQYSVIAYPLNANVADSQSFRGTCR